MRRNVTVCLCAVLSLLYRVAQSGDLECHVTRAGANIAGALVTLCPGGLAKTTDAYGIARFTEVDAGDYTVTAEREEAGGLLGALRGNVRIGVLPAASVDLELTQAVRTPPYFPMREGCAWEYRVRQRDAEGSTLTDVRRERVRGTATVGAENAWLVQVDFAGGDQYTQYEKTTNCGWALFAETLGPALRTYVPPVTIPRLLVRGQPFRSESVAHSDDGSPPSTMITEIEFVGFETITVPAGRFECVRLHLRVEEGPFAVDLRTWMASGVGAVRAYERGSGEDVRRSLVDYTIPGRKVWGRTPRGPLAPTPHSTGR